MRKIAITKSATEIKRPVLPSKIAPPVAMNATVHMEVIGSEVTR